MGKQDIYRIRSTGENTWEVTKADKDFECSEVYSVSLIQGYYNCSCFAGSRETCRHRQMIPEFIAEEAVNTNKWYWFDKRKWIEGPSHDQS